MSTNFSLHSLFLNSITCDILFRVDSKTIPAHKCIIQQNKKIFTLTNCTNEYEIENISAEAFEKILEFLYTGNLDLSYQDAYLLPQIVYGCEQFELNELLESCLSQFDNIINHENFILILKQKPQNEMLKKLCFNYFHKFRKELISMKEFKSLDKEIMLDLLRITETIQVPKFKKLDGSKTLQQHLQKLYKTKELSDVVILSNDNIEFSVHKAILVACSEYFETALNMTGGTIRGVELVLDFPGKVIQFIFDYAYLKSVNLPKDVSLLIQLYNLTKLLVMKSLNESTIQMLQTLITNDNVFDIFHFCLESKIEGSLKSKCLQVLKNMEKDKIIEFILKSHLRFEKQLESHQFENNQIIQNLQQIIIQKDHTIQEKISENQKLKQLLRKNDDDLIHHFQQVQQFKNKLREFAVASSMSVDWLMKKEVFGEED